MEADHLLHDLDDSQRRAVTSPARPLAILAPAGSGKTRVLTRRIAWRVAAGDAEASHVLALTFTRKAAGELRERLRGLGLRDGLAVGTFHGVAWAQLRSRWADEGRAPPGLLTRKAELLGTVLAGPRGGGTGTGSTGTGTGPGGAGPTPGQLAAEIEWAKARLVGPADYAEAAAGVRRRTPADPERIAALYTRYEEEKRRRRVVDFDDILRLASDLFETDRAFAAVQRWRFRHLFVDEFQDVNPLQMHLLEAWRADRYDLCVVGDPHQAIYGWNGADASFLERFQERYPPAEVILLERNYRSTPQILLAAAGILRAARTGDRPVLPVRAEGRPPRLERHPTDHDEAHAVARAVRDRRAPGARWSAQAVLVRTHAQIPLLAEALRRAGIPHRTRGDDALGRPEVREALDLLRRGDRSLAACLPDLAALAAEPGLGDEARANVEMIARYAHDHLQLDTAASPAGFVPWLVTTLQAEGAGGAADAVTLATFHAAKGLEWPIVHIAGTEDGFVPITHARNPRDRAEEARLLYVAMTRAEDELRLTWAAQRTFGGRPVERRLSPWLSGLADRQRERPSASGALPDDWRTRLAEQRARLATAASAAADPPATGEAPALAALRAWREAAARAARVPPGAVLDDRLLEAIAERRPASLAELAAVPGMGPLLAARVGDGLLAALAGAGGAGGDLALPRA